MAVVATGFFDGVHLGHRLVIDTLVRAARERGTESVAVTFWPHPRTVLQDDAVSLRLLTSLEEKIRLLKECGVDRVEVLDFTKEFSRIDTLPYLRDILRGRFGAQTLVLGYDNRIGHDLLSPEETASIAAGLGLEVLINMPFRDVSGVAVSSSKIRGAISRGDVEAAAGMLGRPYQLKGVVVGGKRLGRTIGFPTANMQLYEPLKIVPSSGAYLTEVDVPGGVFFGMTNVGSVIETHILDFDEQIYGRDIDLKFLRRLRDERQFAGLDALKEQLCRDKVMCFELINNLI